MLPSKKKIGVIGAGQLGLMLAESGLPFQIRYNMLDVSNSPAEHLAETYITGSITDANKTLELANISDVITYEIEHVHIETLLKLEAEGKEIIPSPRLLEIIKDKGLQKLFYRENGIPTTRFVIADNPTQWAEKLTGLNGDKIVAKLRTGGYDGRGVAIVSKKQMIEEYGRIPFDGPVVLEEFVEEARELAIIVARDSQNDVKIFPIVEMKFDPVANLVKYLYAPAEINEETATRATEICVDAILKLQGVGVFAIELFLNKSGDIFINEIAPRPHNSGHHTIEACYTSQYEQLNRILLGLPLGDTSLIQPTAMINILGEEGINGDYTLTGLDEILKIPGVYIHLYNKVETRPWRKMGHITILAENMDKLKEKVELVNKAYGMTSIQSGSSRTPI